MLGSDALCYWGRVVRLQSFSRNGTQTRWKEDVIFFPSKIRFPFSVIFCKMQPRTLYVNNCRQIKCYLFFVCTLIRLADQIGGKTHCLLWACTILRQSTFAVLCCGLMIQRFLPLSLSHRLYLLIKIPNTFFYLSFDKKSR